MTDAKSTHNRRSIRLPGYDYSQPGAYFFTIVTRGREPLFGQVVNDEMLLSAAGLAVHMVWDALTARFSMIETDAFVVMPNHVHGVLFIGDDGARGGAGAARDAVGAASSAPTLGTVLRALKSLSARAVNRSMGCSGGVWQRDYFERVIRNERELTDIRRYIVDNPLRWALDHENPENVHT
ncbi:MAG: transposase [Dehalococcoidia bacterium]